jgi:hypothetical protein
VAALIALALALLVLIVGEPVERLVHRIANRESGNVTGSERHE